MWGSYSWYYNSDVTDEKVCPPCGGVILRTITEFFKKFYLSPVWGSYSNIDGIKIIKFRKFVPRIGSYSSVCLLKRRNKNSLSPVRGSYSLPRYYYRNKAGVCPPCGGVIPTYLRQFILPARFVPRAGSYSWLSFTLLPQNDGLSPARGSYSCPSRLLRSTSEFIPRTGELFFPNRKPNFLHLLSLSSYRGVFFNFKQSNCFIIII